MIVKIGEGLAKYDGVINYHDNKVQNDKASVISSSFGLTDKKDVINHLNEISELNKSVKNKGFDISLNFNINDNVSDQKALNIVNDYLIGMELEVNPYIIYRHNDKDHQHYHIVVSSTDEEGVYSQKMRSFYKKDSQRLSRELELKYGLISTEYKKQANTNTQNNINYDAYQMQKAINLSLKNPSTGIVVKNLIGNIEPLLSKNKLNNQHLAVLLDKDYEVLKDYLIKNNFFKFSLKSQLIDNLSLYSKQAKNLDTFIVQLNNNNIYARHIKGKNEMIYGVLNPEDSNVYYFKEKALPERFSYKKLIGVENKKSFSIDDQKLFIKNNISLALKKSKSISDFQDYLLDRNIEIIYSKNESTVSGISFKSKNIENATQFKGSEINRNYSWNNIKTIFENQSAIHILPEYKEEMSVSLKENDLLGNDFSNNYIDLYDITRLRKYDYDDEDDYKRKKKNQKRGR